MAYSNARLSIPDRLSLRSDTIERSIWIYLCLSVPNSHCQINSGSMTFTNIALHFLALTIDLKENRETLPTCKIIPNYETCQYVSKPNTTASLFDVMPAKAGFHIVFNKIQILDAGSSPA